MADLPDLDTSSIGYLAYWQAIDQGGLADVAPEEVLSSGNIASYTLFDNGVQGVYNSVTGLQINFRVKSDGWMVAFMGRGGSYPTTYDGTMLEDQNQLRGEWDVLNNWAGYGGASDIQQNTLERAINDLFGQLSNSGNGTFNTGDVGLYHYGYSSATTSTLLSSQENESGGSGNFRTTGFSYTAATTRLHHSISAAGQANSWSGGKASGTLVFESNTILDTDQGSSTGDYSYAPVYYTVDVMDAGWAPNSGTEYTTEWNTSGDDGRSTELSMNHLLIWN